MSLFGWIKDWASSRRTASLDQWFVVTFDETNVWLKAAPPGREAWAQSFAWSSIVRVCFKDEGPYQSDGIYVFTSQRPELYVIPTEAKGGSEFFGALVSKGLFPAELMGKAITSTNGGLYCWPALENGANNG
jgi:hypothetical protein